MAKTDELMKKLFKHKEIFADLFNATLFNGKQIIKAEKLAELNTENIHVDESISSDVNPSILDRETNQLYITSSGIRKALLNEDMISEDLSEITKML